ncbi:hypothetical protein GP486_000174 [Trichoglossum hirsutum]|uniref:DUF221-domain-containing protein n=1 Tax=Trichoglossum hirsutum TaxID=265104 RepID=A0A9P8LJ91_9PEZI|nr:hypothetical protein GP486_000174 [Trichoglossum hirsutum]
MNLSSAIDASAGKAQEQQGESLNSFLASITAAGATFVAELLAFLLIRNKLPLIYQRRIYLKRDRIGAASSTIKSLLKCIFETPDSDIIRECGLDAYFFLRYLRTLLKIFVPLALVIIPVLLPLNVRSGRGEVGGVNGLDRLSWSNVGPTYTERYWVHLTVAVGVVTYVSYILFDEFREYTLLRREHLTSSQRYNSSTILVTSIPEQWLSPEALDKAYGASFGKVCRIWINRDFRKLSEKIAKRNELVLELEVAETNFVVEASKKANMHNELEKKRLKVRSSKGNGHATDLQSHIYRGPQLWSYLADEGRDYMRLPPFGWTWMPSVPFVGEKVDKIDYCRRIIAGLNAEIMRDQKDPSRFPAINSAFIQFEHQRSADMACQCLSHPSPNQMVALKAFPDDIIWENLPINWRERYVRTALIMSVVAGLVIGWGIPVTFTGLVSQLAYLAAVMPRLGWINKLPGWLLGVIQGILPPVILSILMALVPTILRILAQLQGEHTVNAVELSVQNYYFTFLFLQVFLGVSLSAGITAVVRGLANNLRSVPTVLAENLPKASNYFFSYMLLQAFSVSAGVLVQIGGLVNWFILSPLRDRTARQKWIRQKTPAQVQWGTYFPVYTNLACIGQAIVMVVVTISTIIYQYVLNETFGPLFRYTPIAHDGVKGNVSQAGEVPFPPKVLSSSEHHLWVPRDKLGISEREVREILEELGPSIKPSNCHVRLDQSGRPMLSPSTGAEDVQ